jgi:hypothetical protein
VVGSNPYNATSSTITVPTAPLTAITNTKLLTVQDYIVKDSSSSALTLTSTISSAYPFSQFTSSSPWSSDTNGGSYNFDGTGDYLTAPTSSDLCQWYNTNYTIEMWVYPRAFSSSENGGSPAYGSIALTTTGESFSFGPILGGTVRFYYYDTSVPQIRTVTTSATIPLNRWTHLAFVNNSNALTIYINGVSSATGTITGTPDNSTGVSGFIVTAGKGASSSAARWFNGYISNLRVLRGTALYTSNFTPPMQTLTDISNTKLLLTGSEAPIYDGAKLNNLLTRGNAQVRTNITNYNSSSVYFDGTGDYIEILNNESLDFGTADFCLEAWLYPTSFSNYRSIYNRANDGTSSSVGWFFVHTITTGRPYFGYGNSSASEYVLSDIALSLNTWTHFAGTRSGNTLKLYLNGVLRSTQNTPNGSANHDKALPGYIGYFSTTNPYPWIGYMDGFRITKGNIRYTANFTPPERLPGR